MYQDPNEKQQIQAERQMEELTVMEHGFPKSINDDDDDQVHAQISMQYLMRNAQLQKPPQDPAGPQMIMQHLDAHMKRGMQVNSKLFGQLQRNFQQQIAAHERRSAGTTGPERSGTAAATRDDPMISRIQLFFRCVWTLMRQGGAHEFWDDAWGPQDQGTLSTFLNSETGKRLSGRLRATSLLMNHRGVMSGRPWKCGYASGYMGALADLELLTTLSDISEPSEAENYEPSRAEDLIDRLAQ